MSDLHELLTSTASQHQPSDAPEFASLVRRHQRRQTRKVAALCSSLALIAVALVSTVNIGS